mmetsp:Transcript_23712/g.76228  ORF Transcript_23712/g.76228 Transcript_23712/m.76228 type:complete len:145 (-) Transcript_23712:152-586(-)
MIGGRCSASIVPAVTPGGGSGTGGGTTGDDVNDDEAWYESSAVLAVGIGAAALLAVGLVAWAVASHRCSGDRKRSVLPKSRPTPGEAGGHPRLHHPPLTSPRPAIHMRGEEPQHVELVETPQSVPSDPKSVRRSGEPASKYRMD